MTRRNGVIAALATICGLISSRAHSEEDKAVGGFTYSTSANSIALPRSNLVFALDTFTEFKFTLGSESVTITPAEIMAALKSN